MIVRYSLKQMFRSRLKTLLFFLLLVGSACLLSLGINLWYMNQRSIDEFEEIFTTIGTVQQKQHDMGLEARWNEKTGKNVYYENLEYGEIIKDTELLFEGADYLIEPCQRPYFGADMSYFQDFTSINDSMKANYFTAEFVPLESYNGSKPIELEIVKSYCEEYQEGEIISFFHFEDVQLDAGKRYIASFISSIDVNGDGVKEFNLGSGLRSTQYNKDGSIRETTYEEAFISEVTDGFYETEIGKCWLEQSKAIQQFSNILPVTPVHDTNLIMAFYEQRAYVKDGRNITEDEYQQGVTVCLIPQHLANQLNLEVGDSLRLPLFYASYYETPSKNFSLSGGGFNFTLLNADGKQYKVFDDQTYEVVGIYDITNNLGGEHALSPVEIIIPYNSVKGLWDNNIVSFGPMSAGNTSFEIKNGMIDEFVEKWNQQEFADELEVIFYDKGYSELEKGIESRKIMSGIFLLSGLLLSLVILTFFCNLFITGQKQRIAVERILGLSKKDCGVSILSGLLFVAAAGVILGSMIGWVSTDYVSMQLTNTISYDSLYSITIVYAADVNTYENIAGSFMAAVLTIVILMIFSFVISGLHIKKALEDEPLIMLGKLED